VVWGLLVWLSVRSSASVSIAFALAMTIQSTGILIMLAGYLQGGAAAFPLGAATVGTVASLYLLTSHPNVHAPIGLCVVGLGSLLMIGRFFGGLSTEVALVLLLAPLLCWGTEWLPLRCRPGWVVGLLRLLLVAIPLTALLLQAKRKFDRDTAPLLMRGCESQGDDEMHRQGVQSLASGSLAPDTSRRDYLSSCPSTLFREQLWMSGRIVIPSGENLNDQVMYRFTRLAEETRVEHPAASHLSR
jgi:hypothetical protein